MSANLFWFSDEQWSKNEPHLPSNQPGPQRHDHRRDLERNHARAVQKSVYGAPLSPSAYGSFLRFFARTGLTDKGSNGSNLPVR